MIAPAAADAPEQRDESWLAPAALAAAFGRALAWWHRDAPAWPGFESGLAAARSAQAILVVETRHVASAALALRRRAVFALPADRSFDGLAGLIDGCGSRAIRIEPGRRPDMILHANAVVAAPVSVDPDLAWTLPDIAMLSGHLARPVTTLAIAGRRLLSFDAGLPGPVDIVARSARSAAVGQHPCPHGKIARALVSDALKRDLAEARSAVDRKAEPQRRGQATAVLAAYRGAMAALSLLAGPYLRRRLARGREDRARLGERYGRATHPRPAGRLLWIHGASVGEAVSILPLIDAVLRRHLVDGVVVTTGTLTSARVMDERLPARAIHQFVPLDAPSFARRFLDHWRPDVAVLVESELWPNLMRATRERDIPLAMVNARLSERSFRRWRRLPDTARAVLDPVDVILAQGPAHALRLAALGARLVRHEGNLKFDSPPPPFDEMDLAGLDEAVRLRPIWVAASTHEGEEAAVAEAHLAARDRFPDLLTVIVPRHPERGQEIARLIGERSLATALRSSGAAIGPEVDVYIADTIGELGLFYRIAPVVFVGGSLVAAGGHNPIEPAHLGCAIIHGPHVANFADMYEDFGASTGALEVADAAALAATLVELIADRPRVEAMAAASRKVIDRHKGALARTVWALEPLLER